MGNGREAGTRVHKHGVEGKGARSCGGSDCLLVTAFLTTAVGATNLS